MTTKKKETVKQRLGRIMVETAQLIQADREKGAALASGGGLFNAPCSNAFLFARISNEEVRAAIFAQAEAGTVFDPCFYCGAGDHLDGDCPEMRPDEARD